MKYSTYFDLDEFRFPKELKERIAKLTPRQLRGLDNCIHNELGSRETTKDAIIAIADEYCDGDLDDFEYRNDFIIYNEDFDVFEYPFDKNSQEIIEDLTTEERKILGDYIVSKLGGEPIANEIDYFMKTKGEPFIEGLRTKRK